MSVKLDKKALYKALQWDFVNVYPVSPYAAATYDGEVVTLVGQTGLYPATLKTWVAYWVGYSGAHLGAGCRVWSPDNPTQIFMFFFEPSKGNYDNYQGFGYGYVAVSRSGGAATSTSLTGQNWAVEHDFRIRHKKDQTECRFYIDGAEVAVHTTNISAQPYEILCGEPNGVVATVKVRYPPGIYILP